MEDAAVYRVEWVGGRGAAGFSEGGEAGRGFEVSRDQCLRLACDSLLGWGAVGVLEGFAVELVGGGGCLSGGGITKCRGLSTALRFGRDDGRLGAAFGRDDKLFWRR